MNNVGFTEDYGDSTGMISCLCAVYSRMAYLNFRDFINVYSLIFNKNTLNNIKDDYSKKDIIDIDAILKDMNTSVSNKGLPCLLNDRTLFDLDDSTNKYGLKIATIGERKILQYIPFSYRVNLILGEERKSKSAPDLPNCLINDGEKRIGNDNLVCVNIVDSNYGDVYVFGDKRMPNIVTVAFRGTASAKSAGSYTRPSSLTPTTIETWKATNGESYPIKVLGGIYKILNEFINTIFCAIDHVASTINNTTMNGPQSPNKIKVITTGHSLGGALATLFAFKYVIYSKYTDNRPWLDKNIGCFSLGSPRIFDVNAAMVFCCLVQQNQIFLNSENTSEKLKNVISAIKNFNSIGKITFLRITTFNDPIPALPKAFYRHPCSYEGSELKLIYNGNEEYRKNISEDCLLEVENSFSTRCLRVNRKLVNTNDFKLALNCKNIKRGRIFSKEKTGPFFLNQLVFHTQYMGIGFAGGVDISKAFDTSLIVRAKESTNVKNYNGTKDFNIKKGDTIIRLAFYPSKSGILNADIVYFDLVHYRDIYVNDKMNEDAQQKEPAGLNIDSQNGGEPLQTQTYPEDIYVNQNFFKKILEGINNKAFDQGTDLELFNKQGMLINITDNLINTEYNTMQGGRKLTRKCSKNKKYKRKTRKNKSKKFGNKKRK